MTEIEWAEIHVRIFYPAGSSNTTHRYKAWKRGHPWLCAYGETVTEAVTSLLNKHGE